MNETMYEVTWVHTGPTTHATVTPITVVRYDVLPGCSTPSITAIDHSGRKFHGSRENYFETKEAAWDSVMQDLRTTIGNYLERAEDLQHRAQAAEAYLNTLLATKKW